MKKQTGKTARIRTGNQSGFTLLEMLAVVALIAIVSYFAFGQYQKHITRARTSKAAQIVASAMQQFAAEKVAKQDTDFSWVNETIDQVDFGLPQNGPFDGSTYNVSREDNCFGAAGHACLKITLANVPNDTHPDGGTIVEAIAREFNKGTGVGNTTDCGTDNNEKQKHAKVGCAEADTGNNEVNFYLW